MDAFKSFDIIYSVTKGGPAYATYTMVIGAYQESFPFIAWKRSCIRNCNVSHSICRIETSVKILAKIVEGHRE